MSSPEGRRWPVWVERIVFSEYFVAWLCVAFYALAAVTIPGFASGLNTLNIVGAMLPLLVLATGQTVVVLTGGIDLSIMSLAALCGVSGAIIMTGEGGLLAGNAAAAPAVLLAMLLVGLAAGAGNGVCVAVFGMPAFIVTLVGMLLWGGVAVWMTQSQTYYLLPDSYLALGQRLLPALALGLLVAGTAHLTLTRTAYGAWIHAIGQNPRAAIVAGVPVRRMLVMVYAFSGLCAAIGAILLTARLESASPVMGKRMLLDVIGATVIGGTSLYGGSGKITWTLFGVAFLAMVDNSLNLVGASFAMATIAKGAIILFAAVMDAVKRREMHRNG